MEQEDAREVVLSARGALQNFSEPPSGLPVEITERRIERRFGGGAVLLIGLTFLWDQLVATGVNLFSSWLYDRFAPDRGSHERGAEPGKTMIDISISGGHSRASSPATFAVASRPSFPLAN